jgi:type II secretory pathway component PulM
VSAAETLRHEAQALLADDPRQVLSEAREAIEHISASTRQAQHQAVQAVQNTVSQLRRAAERLDQSAQAARCASVGLTWKVALIAILCGVGSAGLTSGLGHWLPRGSAQAERQQALGAELERRWRAMTPKEQTQLRKLMQGSEP